MDQDAPRRQGSPRNVYALTVVAAALAGFGAVYAIARAPDNGSPAAQPAEPAATRAPVKIAQVPAALPSGPGANALSVGEMAKFVFKKAPEALPDVKFLDGGGRERTLADWKGKVVLLNVWATWCLPCRKEMPSLERLQSSLGSDTFEVVAVSADRGGIDAARKFLDQINVSKLGVYADPSIRLTAALKVVGMPGTLLIDKDGREVGRLVGPAEWDSAEAKALIAAVMR